MSETKKLRNLVAPPLTGERKINAAKYTECVDEYANGVYGDDLVWAPACKRECENCPHAMSRDDYIRAMNDVAVRR